MRREPGFRVLMLHSRQRHAREKGSTITDEIRRVLGAHARLVVNVADLSDKDDLFRLGMTSHASVSVMLALEDTFGVEFPEHMLRRSTFESISSIESAIAELLERVSGD
jgi:acyl carrier protein